ncbi:hypothetical protein [Streptomyces sp. NPDC007905]|uniref:hypothetical protein n=1 Tax=Streptomyces sp. NPDC007905 TaxID=3364788 RepID=UPI0036EF5523
MDGIAGDIARLAARFEADRPHLTAVAFTFDGDGRIARIEAVAEPEHLRKIEIGLAGAAEPRNGPVTQGGIGSGFCTTGGLASPP